MRSARGIAHLSTRLAQTPVLFRNFPRVLAGLVASETPWGPDEMTFRLRNGYTVTTPNVDGARFPVYEVFAGDGYDLADFCVGLDEDATVLDIGGQVGCFSLAVSKRLPRARVHVYEASPVSASYVQRNVDVNGLADRVTVHATAMAGEEGWFTFTDSGTANGQNSFTGAGAAGAEVTVPCTTFDRARAAAPGVVQLVKIDTEGAEYDIVLSSDKASWDGVRKVVFEYHRVAGRSLAELMEFFEALGFRTVRHDPSPEPGLGVMWLSRVDA